ncbi:hypothetical protein [Anaerorhabdus sp.]|uniref:hypothetical protein n=1 Tax=Anaerorhabdus sp. TaxID=1872524 RepID=UPI002FC84229
MNQYQKQCTVGQLIELLINSIDNRQFKLTDNISYTLNKIPTATTNRPKITRYPNVTEKNPGYGTTPIKACKRTAPIAISDKRKSLTAVTNILLVKK